MFSYSFAADLPSYADLHVFSRGSAVYLPSSVMIYMCFHVALRGICMPSQYFHAFSGSSTQYSHVPTKFFFIFNDSAQYLHVFLNGFETYL